MILGETLNTNDVESLERERMALGLDLCTVVTSDVVYKIILRNKTGSLLVKLFVEHGVTSHHCNKSKVKVKEVAIAVHDYSTEVTLKELN